MGQELGTAIEKFGQMTEYCSVGEGMKRDETKEDEGGQERHTVPGHEDVPKDDEENPERVKKEELINYQNLKRKDIRSSEASVPADSTTANDALAAERNFKKSNIDTNKTNGSNRPTCADSGASYVSERSLKSSERNSKTSIGLNLTDSRTHDRIQPANGQLERYPLRSGSCAGLGNINSPPIIGYRPDSTYTPSRGRNCDRFQSITNMRDCTPTSKPRSCEVTYIKHAFSTRTRNSGEEGRPADLRHHDYCRDRFRNMSNVEGKGRCYRSNDYNEVNSTRKREEKTRFSSSEIQTRLTEGHARSSRPTHDRYETTRERRRNRSHSRDHNRRQNPDHGRATASWRTSGDDRRQCSSHAVGRNGTSQTTRKSLKRRYDGRRNSVSPHRYNSRSKRYSDDTRKYRRIISSSSASPGLTSNSESANEDKKKIRSAISSSHPKTSNANKPDEVRRTKNDTKTKERLEDIPTDVRSFSRQTIRDKSREKQNRNGNSEIGIKHNEAIERQTRNRVEIESGATSGAKSANSDKYIGETNPGGGPLDLASSVEDPAQTCHGNDFERDDKSNENRATVGEILSKDPPANEAPLGVPDRSSSSKSWSYPPEHSDLSTNCDQVIGERAVSVNPDCRNSPVSSDTCTINAVDPFHGCVGARLERPVPPASLIHFLSANLPDEDLGRLRGLIGAAESTSGDEEWLFDQLERSLHLSAVRSVTDVARCFAVKVADSTGTGNNSPPSPDESTMESVDPLSSGVRDSPPRSPGGEGRSSPDAPSPRSDESISLFSPSSYSHRNSGKSATNCSRKEKTAEKDQRSTRVEKIASAVKKVALPLFFQKKITKDEYKQLMRKVVSQILRNKDDASEDLFEKTVHRSVFSASSALK